jgi:hypothetical protein
MTGIQVVFQRRASKDVERIDEWWRRHRPSSPDLFLTELHRAIAFIGAAPALGVAARSERVPGLRRIGLQRTRYQRQPDFTPHSGTHSPRRGSNRLRKMPFEVHGVMQEPDDLDCAARPDPIKEDMPRVPLDLLDVIAEDPRSG